LAPSRERRLSNSVRTESTLGYLTATASFDANPAGQASHRDRRAGRFVIPKRLGVHLVKRVEVGQFGALD
jgi:hypothetical protein